jgi:hypothetical protein
MLNLGLLYFENAKQANNHNMYKESEKWFRQLVLLQPSLARPYFYLG